MTAVREGWNLLDESWTLADRHALVRCGDGELMRRIREVRDEFHEGTHTVEEDAAVLDQEAMNAALVEARGRINGSMSALVDWVAGLPVRGWAVYQAETELADTPRESLLRQMRPLRERFLQGVPR